MDVALEHRFASQLSGLAVPWQAEPAPSPRLVALNDSLATELGWDAAWLRSPEGVGLLLGTRLPDGALPVAQAYSGHQFGGFSPRLGDGRALLLGELSTPGGLVDVHLKGSGRTPFARGGDGRAALGPMLREYLVSEAMHALGVPTTRSLAVVATGQEIQRETLLPGAVLTRVASSHLRVGSFQFARATGDVELLRALADFAIERHYPELAGGPDRYLTLYRAVVAKQAELIARWMSLGFVHGVMNTDNMTISGETIDYGPCAFLDGYSPGAVFSSIDEGGRYAFGNQPAVATWNLARFAEALLPLFDADEQQAIARASEALGSFTGRYGAAWLGLMAAKLGLAPERIESLDPDAVGALVEELLTLLEGAQADWTGGFRAVVAAARGDRDPLRNAVLDLGGIDAWLTRWLAMAPDAELADRSNPVYIPRNHRVEAALAAATTGDLKPFEELLAVVREPFGERAAWSDYAQPAPAEFAEGFRTFCGT